MSFANSANVLKIGLAIFFSFFIKNLVAQKIIVKNDLVYSFSSGEWEYLRSNDKNIPFKKIVELFDHSKFKPINASVLNGGIATEYYWIHFSILNAENTTNSLVVDIESPRLNELELYEVTPNESRSLGKAGDFFPFDKRAVLHKNYIYKVSLQSHQSKDYYLFVNQVGHTLILPIQIFKSRRFEMESYGDYLLEGLTYGILIFVSVFSLLFFINTMDNLYFYYSLYILTAIVWLFSYFGIGYQYLWGNYPNFSTVSSPLMASLNILLNIQICKLLLRLKEVNHLFYKLSTICQTLLLLVGLFPIFVNLNTFGYEVNHTYLTIFLCVILVSVFNVFFYVSLYSFRGSLSAKVYFLASLLKTVSIINLALLELGITPAVYNLESILEVGLLIEIILLTYALAKRYERQKTSDQKIQLELQNSMAQMQYRFQKELLQTQLEIQEQTFKNISQEIHDNIGQVLSLVKLNINTMDRDKPEPLQEKIDNSRTLITKAIQDLRDLSKSLNTDYVIELGLMRSIEYEMEMIQKTGSYDIAFTTNGKAYRLERQQELILFRIVQEVLHNIIKHAKATKITVTALFESEAFMLTIADNGIGFDAGKIESNNYEGFGLGIRNMNNRARMINADYKLTSTLQKGTTVMITMPVTENI